MIKMIINREILAEILWKFIILNFIQKIFLSRIKKIECLYILKYRGLVKNRLKADICY